MVCAIPLHRLARRAETEAQAGVCDQTGCSGMGTGVPDAEAGRRQHDFRELRGALRKGRKAQTKTQHLAHQGKHHPEENPAVLQKAETVRDHGEGRH